MKIIRSDSVKIKTNPLQAEMLEETLNLYRCYVRDLMVLINARWLEFHQCKGNEIVSAVETLIHPTAKRPTVKHSHFHKKYYKFPSYLRRVAISDASGQVRSFQTKFYDWVEMGRHGRPPKLTCSTLTFPSLYEGGCIKYGDDPFIVRIKLYHQNDWVWQDFKLAGKYRFLGKGKRLSPLLTKKGKGFQLSFPSKIDVQLRKEKEYSGKILSVDVGINTEATCSVIDKYGTVHDRMFIHRSDKDRTYFLMNRIRSKAKKQTRHGGKLPYGFAGQDHRRLKQLNDNETHQISRRIVDHAARHNCDAIILEHLKGWRPKGGKKRSNMKAKFHRWFHRMLCDRIESKAHGLGIRVIYVYPRGTSSYAFDGSGKVKRDETNYTLATFKSGKRYNADLNASYNIGARGILRLYYPSSRKQGGSLRKQKSSQSTRNPWVLSSIWEMQKAEYRKAG